MRSAVALEFDLSAGGGASATTTCAASSASSRGRRTRPSSTTMRRRSAMGCSGVFCNSCHDDHWASRRAGRETPRSAATCRCRARRRRGRAGLRPCARVPSAGLRVRAPPRARRGASARARRRAGRRRSRERFVKRHWLQHAFERMCAAVLRDKQSSGLPLHVRRDEHRPGFGRALDARGDIGGLAEHAEASQTCEAPPDRPGRAASLRTRRAA